MNRGLGKIVVLYILYGLRSRNLACVQVLYKQSSLRIGPQGAVVEVARADGIYFNICGNQLQRKALGQTNAAELTACVSAVVLGAYQTGLRINLDNIEPLLRIASCCAFMMADAYLAALKYPI